jgi:hypothetical protein
MRESETTSSEHLTTADLAAASGGAGAREVPEAREAPENQPAEDNLAGGMAPPEEPEAEEPEAESRDEEGSLESGLAPREHEHETPEAVDAGQAPETGPDMAAEDEETPEARQEPRAGLDESAPPLFTDGQIGEFRQRWQGIQIGFGDDPHRAVREADELVAAVISALASTFAEHRSELETQWHHGEPATEDLRVVLRRYRAFFDQLLGG